MFLGRAELRERVWGSRPRPMGPCVAMISLSYAMMHTAKGVAPPGWAGPLIDVHPFIIVASLRCPAAPHREPFLLRCGTGEVDVCASAALSEAGACPLACAGQALSVADRLPGAGPRTANGSHVYDDDGRSARDVDQASNVSSHLPARLPPRSLAYLLASHPCEPASGPAKRQHLSHAVVSAVRV